MTRSKHTQVRRPGAQTAGGLASQPAEFLSRKQVAQLLGVSIRTVHNLVAARRLPAPIAFSPRTVRWSKAAIVAMAAGTNPAAAPGGSA